MPAGSLQSRSQLFSRASLSVWCPYQGSASCLSRTSWLCFCIYFCFFFCWLLISTMLAAVAGIVGKTNASQNVRTACKKCGYGKM